jgi:filamentous hemagglutinin family protein
MRKFFFKEILNVSLNLSLKIATSLSIVGFATTPVFAQSEILPDSTLETENSNVVTNFNNLPVEVITGGATRGINLFHSFREFNVSEGRGAYFLSPSADIQNILARVTGGSRSEILGRLGTIGESKANLFLMNPNGIIFGENASLDVGGSFVATTANAIAFGERGNFSATNPQEVALLSVNPSALFFNQINQNAAIQNNASTTGLVVDEGKSLLLVGGNISMDGGILFALGGDVELGGLAEAGNVGIQQDAKILSLNFPVQVERADVLLNNSAGVAVISGDRGSVAINARNIDILGGSQILAGILGGLGTSDSTAGDITLNATREIKVEQGSYIRNEVISDATGNGGNLTINAQNLLVQSSGRLQVSTFGKGEGGNLTVNTSDKIELVGTSADGLIPSGLFTLTLQPSTGNAGNITIKTQDLFVRDGAQLVSATSGVGKGGDLIVNASRQIELVGTSSQDVSLTSGLGASAQPGSIGDAGDLTINTQNLFIRDGAQVNTTTLGAGKAGNLTVNASEKVELIGQGVRALLTGFASSSELGSTGDAGDLTINTQDLLVQDRAQIATSTSGSGKGGNLIINASKRVQLGGNVTASAEPFSTGNAGNLTINTQDLLVRDSGKVLAITFGTGKGGNLSVNASGSVQVIGTSADGLLGSSLATSAQSDSTGNAGDLTINTPDLLVRDGAQVSAGTFGAGDGGKLTINASNSVQIVGESADSVLRSGLYASAEFNSIGNAGDLTIKTPNLLVSNGAGVFVNSLGAGNAGIMTIEASRINLDNNASINANTRSPNKDPNREQATINIRTQDLRLRRNSNITTNATGENVVGGNINIDTNFLIALENSRISANSDNSRGGRVKINAQGVFVGTQPSDTSKFITATSGIGLSGTVDVNSPDNSSIQNSLTELPTNAIDTNALIANSCIARANKKQENSFIITGTGALPNRPGDVSMSNYSTDKVRGITDENTSRPWKKGDRIIEPTGVYRTASGELILSRKCQ